MAITVTVGINNTQNCIFIYNTLHKILVYSWISQTFFCRSQTLYPLVNSHITNWKDPAFCSWVNQRTFYGHVQQLFVCLPEVFFGNYTNYPISQGICLGIIMIQENAYLVELHRVLNTAHLYVYQAGYPTSPNALTVLPCAAKSPYNPPQKNTFTVKPWFLGRGNFDHFCRDPCNWGVENIEMMR